MNTLIELQPNYRRYNPGVNASARSITCTIKHNLNSSLAVCVVDLNDNNSDNKNECKSKSGNKNKARVNRVMHENVKICHV